VACWPCEQVERRRLLGGDGATAVEVTGKGAQEGRRTTEKVVAHTVGRGGLEMVGTRRRPAWPWRTRPRAASQRERARKGE